MLPRGKHGISNYKQMLELERQGKVVEELLYYRKAKIPISLRNYWNSFLDMNGRRRYSDGFPEPISFSEIIAYGQCRGIPVAPIESKVIISCDDIFLSVYGEIKRGERESSVNKEPTSRRR